MLLLLVLFGALFTMVFGWAVKSTLGGSDRTGAFGRAAVAIAGFPTLARNVFSDVRVDVFDRAQPNRVPRERQDLTGFSEVRARPGLDISGLLIRTPDPSRPPSRGWRILVGAFTVAGTLRDAAVVLSPELEVSKVWVLSETDQGDIEAAPDHRTLAHGFAILPDASVVFTFDQGGSLQRMDRCGVPVWSVIGPFHHTVTAESDGAHVWALRGHELVRVASEDGEIVRSISMDDVVRSNSTTDILEIRRYMSPGYASNARNEAGEWGVDPIHLNDVEPLPTSLADRFEGFEAGDLLVSARSLNLVFVLDPQSLAVKWWRIGATRRQHDPDWGPDGRISVYDNRMGRDYSRVVRIDPRSFAITVPYDGRRDDFYSSHRGAHQFTDSGDLLLTSPQQGRVLEIHSNGDVALEILNTDEDRQDGNFVVSQAIWMPVGAIDLDDGSRCGA